MVGIDDLPEGFVGVVFVDEGHLLGGEACVVDVQQLIDGHVHVIADGGKEVDVWSAFAHPPSPHRYVGDAQCVPELVIADVMLGEPLVYI